MRVLKNICIIFVVVIICAFICNSTTVAADDQPNSVYGEGMIDEILPDMDRILDSVSGEDITEEELILENAIRVHSDLDPFRSGLHTIDDLKECIQDAPYVYYLPVYKENVTYFLTISKKGGTSEAAGHWTVPAVGEVQTGGNLHADYQRDLNVFLELTGIENKDIYYIGWHSTTTNVAAVLMEKGSTEINDENVSFVLLSKIDPDHPEEIDIGKVMLPYSEIREIVLEEWKGSSYGGGGGAGATKWYQSVWIYIGCAVILAIVITMIIRKKKTM